MKVTCPTSGCRKVNDPAGDTCVRCGTPLEGYARLLGHPARLFNTGLQAARDGQVRRARDLFAALVYWCPLDAEARNALAMACFALGDVEEARLHWREVAARLPSDEISRRGLAAIEALDSMASRKPATPQQAPRTRSARRRRRV